MYIFYIIFLMYILFIYGTHKSHWPQDDATPSKDADLHHVWTPTHSWVNPYCLTQIQLLDPHLFRGILCRHFLNKVSFVSRILFLHHPRKNFYKKLPKIILLQTLIICKPIKNFLKMWLFGQNNYCHRLRKVPQSAINRPIWSHWRITLASVRTTLYWT